MSVQVKNYGVVLMAILLFTYQLSYAQQSSEPESLTFSLKSAQDYALIHNANVKNAKTDIEIAKKKIYETTAIGLPQVTSKLSYSYMLTLPSTLEMISSLSSLGSNFGEIYGMLASLGIKTGDMFVLQKLDSIKQANANSTETSETSLDDMRWGFTYDITATQIIFSGAYIVGLQTAKIFKQLSEIGVEKSTYDVLEQVSNAYYLVLIAEENRNLLDSTYQNTSKILAYVEGMNKQGFNEDTDVDQMKITLSTLENTLQMVTRQVEVAKNLLKFQMGIDIEKNITLTDNLNSLLNSSDLLSLGSAEMKLETNPDYRLMATQEKLSALNLKLQKSTFLPDVVAFYTHQENFNDKSFSFTPPNMIGVAVNIPLFSSGMKLAKVSQAKMGLDKSRNIKQHIANGLKLSFTEARSSYLTAYNKYLVLKQNVLLAERVYNKNIIKYKEGLIGSLELTMAQNQFLQTQSGYYASIIELSAAKSKLEKLLK